MNGIPEPAEASSGKRPAMYGRRRIGVVLPAHWDAVMGGSQYQAKMLVEHLVQTGMHEVHYLARQVRSPGEAVGYRLTRVTPPPILGRYGKFMDTFDLFRLLKELSPDAVYQRVGCAYTGIAVHYAKRFGKRCVWHVAHDREVMPLDFQWQIDMGSRYLDKKMLEYGLRHADAIITQTRHQADCLHKYYGRKADAVIPNYHPLPENTIIKDDSVTVVWVANLKPWKRPEVFLRLARELIGYEGVRFVMIGKPIGDPAWCERIRIEADELANVSYMGGQPQEIVNRVLSGAHIFVNTSRQEGFANTFIQAWLRYVPVLSLSVNPDGILDERKVGIHAGDYQTLKRELIELIGDPHARRAMGQAARLYAEETYANEYNLERIARFIVDV
jgi:glycosyltransferase involved in cell wall biosynthesis